MNKTGQEDKPYANWLYQIPGMGGKKGRELVVNMGSAKEVYSCSQAKLQTMLGKQMADKMVRSRETWNILGEYEKLEKQKIQVTYHHMEDYPGRLKQIPDPPAALYYRGNLPLDGQKSVAIIGARMCSRYGEVIAGEFGSILAGEGIQIISGLAMGVDGISQSAALDAGGKSFGVLGCGVDICYPAGNRKIYETLWRQGGILSEYAPQTPPRPELFPPRNRIISGLSDIVVVVEAKEKSGTMITVDMALEQGKEVFAVPGRIKDSLSEGCNRLIRQGAGIALSAEDILEALCIEREKSSVAQNSFRTEELTASERMVWQRLDLCPKSMEDLYEELQREGVSSENKSDGISIRQLMETLIELSAKGVAQQTQHGLFQRKV